MSKKSKKTGKTKAGRKRSTVKDLSTKNTRAVKGGHSDMTFVHFQKVEVERV